MPSCKNTFGQGTLSGSNAAARARRKRATARVHAQASSVQVGVGNSPCHTGHSSFQLDTTFLLSSQDLHKVQYWPPARCSKINPHACAPKGMLPSVLLPVQTGESCCQSANISLQCAAAHTASPFNLLRNQEPSPIVCPCCRSFFLEMHVDVRGDENPPPI